MRGYLLDVNHIRAHYENRPEFMVKLRCVPIDNQWRICAVTLGEIFAGHLMSTSTNELRRSAYTKFVIAEYLHHVIEITATTRQAYAEILGGIWRKHRPVNSKTRTDDHLVRLGVDINDVWMAASALEHGLILLTSDEMSCIREAAPDLRFESWVNRVAASTAPLPPSLR